MCRKGEDEIIWDKFRASPSDLLTPRRPKKRNKEIGNPLTFPWKDPSKEELHSSICSVSTGVTEFTLLFALPDTQKPCPGASNLAIPAKDRCEGRLHSALSTYSESFA